MNKGILLIVVMLQIGCASNVVKENNESAQTKSDKDQGVSLLEFCAVNTHCRKNFNLKFLTEAGLIDEKYELYWPVIVNGSISILPGEKLFIEAEIVGKKVTNFKHVNTNVHPEKTLIFDFQQMKDDEVGMMLKVKNPFSELLKINLNMVDFEGKLHPTSTCPIIAGGSIFEMWPHAIPELIIKNIFTLKKGASMVCEY